MKTYRAEDVEITLDGIAIPAHGIVTLDREPKRFGSPEETVFEARLPYEVQVEMTMPKGAFERLDLFLRGPRFFFTLERRLRYPGGRKARSALRRIRAFWKREFGDEYPGPDAS